VKALRNVLGVLGVALILWGFVLYLPGRIGLRNGVTPEPADVLAKYRKQGLRAIEVVFDPTSIGERDNPGAGDRFMIGYPTVRDGSKTRLAFDDLAKRGHMALAFHRVREWVHPRFMGGASSDDGLFLMIVGTWLLMASAGMWAWAAVSEKEEAVKGVGPKGAPAGGTIGSPLSAEAAAKAKKATSSLPETVEVSPLPAPVPAGSPVKEPVAAGSSASMLAQSVKPATAIRETADVSSSVCSRCAIGASCPHHGNGSPDPDRTGTGEGPAITAAASEVATSGGQAEKLGSIEPAGDLSRQEVDRSAELSVTITV
jgi:hypothetical protein